MLFDTFFGNDLRSAFDDARTTLGDDVFIVRSDVRRSHGRTRVEVVAARSEALAQLRARVAPPAPALPRADARSRRGPFVIALVGPTGAGKTTTAVKLALNAAGFGAHRVGLLSFDTYRVGALEQMQQFADVGALELEVAYDVDEVPAALRRLARNHVVIIDTPGRSPREMESNAHWRAMLRAAAPDEVHVVLPATIRTDFAPRIPHAFGDCRPSHLLVTKVDECDHASTLVELCAQIDLPVRWVADGQRVPNDVAIARDRVYSALGANHDAGGVRVEV
jgi:flagellar biosynthesis protein FlhF